MVAVVGDSWGVDARFTNRNDAGIRSGQYSGSPAA